MSTEVFSALKRGESFDLELTLNEVSDGTAIDIASSTFTWEVRDPDSVTVLTKTIGDGLIKDSPTTTGKLYIQLRDADYAALTIGVRYTHVLWWDRVGNDVHRRPLVDGVFRFSERGVTTLP